MKVSIPLTEIMRNNSYRGQVSKILNFDPMSDMVNVEDDQPKMIFGLALNGESPDNDVSPFYISLRLHEFVLHNAMFDSGASHNLMPKSLVEYQLLLCPLRWFWQDIGLAINMSLINPRYLT